jgi:hypothetical protein
MTELDKNEDFAGGSIQDDIHHLKDMVNGLEERVSRVEEILQKPQPKQRKPRNYEDYLKAKEVLARGVSINGAAKVLKIPYTTVHYYATAKPETVERLKKASRAIHGEGCESGQSGGEREE